MKKKFATRLQNFYQLRDESFELYFDKALIMRSIEELAASKF